MELLLQLLLGMLQLGIMTLMELLFMLLLLGLPLLGIMTLVEIWLNKLWRCYWNG